MSYSYLDGSMTGSLLSGQPISPTSAPGNYVPGQGTAPYSSTPGVSSGAVSGASSLNQQASAMGLVGVPDLSNASAETAKWWANKLQSLASGHDFSMPGGVTAPNGITSGASPQGPGVSSMNFHDYTGGSTGSGSGTASGLTVIGQQTPEELARNASIMNAPVGSGLSFGGSSGGGGGGAGGSMPSGSTSMGSGLFQPTSSATSAGAAPSSVPIYNAPSTSGVPYNSPGGLQAAPQSQGGVLAMQQASPQSAINQYQNTAGYQMLGNDQTNQYQQSPGYQYAVNEALRQVQSQGASRGLLDSGRVQRDMTDRAVGMAQQDYGNWWNRQNQLYSDYQNRLAGLAGGSVGADQANQLGTNQSQGTYQTGGNLASLFGNQGVAGYGGITNTGAAQSNNMTQAGATQAQIQAANQSTQLAGATLAQRQF